MTEEQAAELIQLLGRIAAEGSATGFPVSEIIAGAAGIIAILAFCWSVYSYRNQQANDLLRRKTELTLALSFEWDSSEMLERRIFVDQYLKNSDKKTLRKHYTDLPFKRMGTDGSAIGWVDISHILHFLEKLGNLIEDYQLDIKLYRSLLANEFKVWHEHISPLLENETEDFKAFLQPVQVALDTALTTSQPANRN